MGAQYKVHSLHAQSDILAAYAVIPAGYFWLQQWTQVSVSLPAHSPPSAPIEPSPPASGLPPAPPPPASVGLGAAPEGSAPGRPERSRSGHAEPKLVSVLRIDEGNAAGVGASEVFL
jgi:hypothetical protein